VSVESRILVVEDSSLLAEAVCNFVLDCGMEPVGPAASLDAGLAFAQAPLDAAILDINLDGVFCFPICSLLTQRHVPFAFLTGYSDLSIIPKPFRYAPLVAKPFEPEEMRSVIDTMLRGDVNGPIALSLSAAGKIAALP
jgi:DNA-binding response OmpR family regulator